MCVNFSTPAICQAVSWGIGIDVMLINVNFTRRTPNKLTMLAREQMVSGEIRYRRGAEIFGEAEPAEFVYQVFKGAVRSYKLLADGRRQIGAFHLPGDMFGFENGDTHRFTAEAIAD